MIPLLTFLAVVALIAHLESSSDTDRIKNGLPIDHAGQLIERMVVCGGSLMAIAAVSKSVEWRTLLWIPAGWSVFTIAFRWMLNRKRVLPYWYISDSNAYDRIWLGILERVKYAAELAYAFEAVILIASLTCYVLTNN